MSNSPISAFNKTEQFFVWAYKAFLYAVYVDIQTYRFSTQIYLIIASYVPQGVMSMSETGMLSKAGKDKEVVETVLPVKAGKEEVVVEPEDETEVEDNTYVGESRSVVTE